MSEEVKAEAAPEAAAPLANGADTSAPDKAAPAADDAKEDFLPETESKPEAKAEGAEKSDAKPEGEAKDFLAETDDDDAKEKADAPGDAKPESAAEAYQPFTLPEGLELDDSVLAKATPILRKHNLDQAAAQELVSLHAETMRDAVQSYHKALSDGHAETLKTWAEATKAHEEFGGKNLTASKALAAQALALEPGARKVLVDYGLDRNPHVFALLARLGSKLSPDSLVRDDAGAPEKAQPMRDADVLYS